MYCVYILKSNHSGKHYIGSTNNLERRLGKWTIIYTEQFATSIEAKRREKQIKSYKGGNAFKKLIAGVVQW